MSHQLAGLVRLNAQHAMMKMKGHAWEGEMHCRRMRLIRE